MFELIGEIIKQKEILLLLLILVIFVYKFEINSDNYKMKLCSLNILVYLLCISNTFGTKSMVLIYLVSNFIFLQIINADKFQKQILNKPILLIEDFIYKICFKYGFIYLLLSLFLVSDYLNNTLSNCDIYNNYNIVFKTILIIISLRLLLKNIVICINDEFKTLDFDAINNKVNKIKRFDDFELSDKLIELSDILVKREDKSYFFRINSYNWISRSFIIYRIKKRYKEYKESEYYKDNKIFRLLTFIIFVFIKFINEVFKISIRPFKYIYYKITNKFVDNDKKVYYPLSRGYSTIEMQLIRTLAVESGYDKYKYRRKIYEFVYSRIFFTCLKSYYDYHVYKNLYKDKDNFKYYLIYLYIIVAPVSLNKKHYNSIFEVFDKNRLEEISEEEFFIWVMGLSHREIGEETINSASLYDDEMDFDYLRSLVNKYK